jgi:hypothetical protein
MTKDPKPEVPKVTCPECEYQNRCFGLLLLAEFWGGLCQQGRKKAVREPPVPKEVKIGNIRCLPKDAVKDPELVGGTVIVGDGDNPEVMRVDR